MKTTFNPIDVFAIILFSISTLSVQAASLELMGNKLNAPIDSDKLRANQLSEAATNATHFTGNKGQVWTTDGQIADFVDFVLERGNTSVFLLSELGIAWQFNRTHYPEGYQEMMGGPKHEMDREKLHQLSKNIRTETYRMDMGLEGANADVSVHTEGRSKDYINYYNRSALNVHHYKKVIYENVYDGIDWVIYTTEKGMKYDFLVHPGADPSQIKMRFSHHEELYLDEDGNLVHGNRMGQMVENAPVSYQEGRKVDTKFIHEDNIVRFKLDDYDPTQQLTIDPERIWGTYYGGNDGDFGTDCATDASGNVYLTGNTYSIAGIAASGYQNNYGGGSYDAFLVKFDSAGNRQWATYYGGSSYEYSASCSVDPSNNVFLVGETSSIANIAFNGYQNTYSGSVDAFVVKFNSSGTREWATYYGGIDGDRGYSSAIDALGNIFFGGQTDSPANISSSGHQNAFGGGSADGFLVKLSSSGELLWGTYYGGSGTDTGYSCATDAQGNIYFSGDTFSSSNISFLGHQNVYGGNKDAFIVKFNAAGIRIWGTYCGGSGSDIGESCSTDVFGNVYMTGNTSSTFNISFNGHQNNLGGGFDAFLIKYSANGARQWGTYYGGPGFFDNDSGRSCATDADGNVYIVGTTTSSESIAFGGHQNAYGGGSSDAFLTKFSSSGIRLWATYYGGTNEDRSYGTATDAYGNVFITGWTKSTGSIASAGHQNAFGGGIWDAFIAKFEGEEIECEAGSLDISGSTTKCPYESFTIFTEFNEVPSGHTLLIEFSQSGGAPYAYFPVTGDNLVVDDDFYIILAQYGFDLSYSAGIFITPIVTDEIIDGPSQEIDDGLVCSIGDFEGITFDDGDCCPEEASVVSPSSQTICAGEQPSDLFLSNVSGDIYWQITTDPDFAINIQDIGNNGLILNGNQVGTLTETSYVRVIADGIGCIPFLSNEVTINVDPGGTNTTTETACESFTWSPNGQTYTQSGTYSVDQDCGTEILQLTILEVTSNTITETACESFTWSVNGQTYTQSGTYTDVEDCNTEILELTITDETENTTSETACNTFTWPVNGQTYTQSGTYSAVQGCITEILELTITEETENTTTETACESFTWPVNGQTYTQSGTYSAVQGCITEILELTITEETENTTTETACESFTWPVNGQTYTQSGTYSAVQGCITEILELTISEETENTTTETACESFTWPVNGQTYTQSGTYSAVQGCITEILDLTISEETENTTTETACESFTWPVNGQTYTQSGTYSAVQGCITEILDLTISEETENTTTETACESFTWPVNGQTYTQSGTYSAVQGCITEILDLTISEETENTTTETACESFTWPVNGQTYTQSGTYSAVQGCITEILDLTISEETENTTTETACESFTWPVNGQTYTQSGTYSAVQGCITEILDLTIVGPESVSFDYVLDGYTLSTDNQSIEGFYQWDFGDGIFSGETSPTHTFQDTGTYEVCLTLVTDCEPQTFCEEIVITNTSILESEKMLFSVYPNPASQHIIIDVENELIGEHLLLHNVLGKELISKRIGETTTQLKLEGYPSGIYFLSIAGDPHQSAKIIKH